MKIPDRFRKTLIVISAGLAVVLAGAGAAYASNEHSITQGTTDHTIYKTGRDVTITGTVNGDIFCAGQTITIDAEVHGDVMCAGQTITIHGEVFGNVRAAGQTVTVNAKVDNNASLAGQDITLPQNANIGRDVGVAGQTVSVLGMVGRDLDVAGNSATLGGPIGRNVTSHTGDKLALQSGASVAGNLEYTSPHLLDKSGKAQVAGKVTYHKAEPRKHHTGWAVMWRLYCLVAAAVLAVVLVALFPQLFRRWNRVAVDKLGWAFLTGFVAIIVVPVVIVIACVTLVGAPLGILLLLLWLAAAILSYPIAMYYLGSRLAPSLHPVLMVLLGAVVLGLIQLIPFLGSLVTGLASVLGAGTLLISLKQSYKAPDYSEK